MKTVFMPNTFSQIYLQFVFAVKGRYGFIPKSHKEELQKFISGIVQNKKCKLLAVNCMPDHTHLFVGHKPNVLISELIKIVKVSSGLFINQKKWGPGNFNWQDGYGVFSYSHSHIDRVIQYINNQESHHKKRTFRDEYLELLEKFAIPFENNYLFEFYE